MNVKDIVLKIYLNFLIFLNINIMWYYKLNDDKYDNGIWKVPKNCINAEWGRFKETLFMEYKQYPSTAILKSAIVSWFGEINKGKRFTINMNGHDNIILQCETDKSKDIYFWGYHLIKGYLVYIDKYTDIKIVEKILERKEKIHKVLNKIK